MAIKTCSNIPQNYSKKEEMANAISHGLGALFSCFALFLLYQKAHLRFISTVTTTNEKIAFASLIVFGVSLILLFLASTIYHSTTHPKTKKLFKLIDHCAIYLLIAGTYTPLLAITLSGKIGYSLLVFIWLLAFAGILFKINFGDQYKKISLATYLGMGMIALTILAELYAVLPFNAIKLLAVGGLMYGVGVIFYVKKSKAYTHAIWHLFVLVGAACHFQMIYLYV